MKKFLGNALSPHPPLSFRKFPFEKNLKFKTGGEKNKKAT